MMLGKIKRSREKHTTRRLVAVTPGCLNFQTYWKYRTYKIDLERADSEIGRRLEILETR